MTGLNREGQRWTYCDPCHKKGYLSKKAAQTIRRGHPERTHLGVYRCPDEPTVWHLGHKPTALRRGTITRDQITRRTA